MLEHLNNPEPTRHGTAAQLAYVVRQAEFRRRERRRHRLAAGSVLAIAAAATTAATASMTGPRTSRALSAGRQPGSTPPSTTVSAPAPRVSLPGTSGVVRPISSFSNSAAPSARKTLVPAGVSAAPTIQDGPPWTAACQALSQKLSAATPPAPGYHKAELVPTQLWWRKSTTPIGSVMAQVQCSTASADTIAPAGVGGKVTPVAVHGHQGWMWHSSDTGITLLNWNVSPGITVALWSSGLPVGDGGSTSAVATPAPSPLNDTTLLAYADSLPTG